MDYSLQNKYSEPLDKKKKCSNIYFMNPEMPREVLLAVGVLTPLVVGLIAYTAVRLSYKRGLNNGRIIGKGEGALEGMSQTAKGLSSAILSKKNK